MIVTKNEQRLTALMGMLPRGVSDEIVRLSRSRRGGLSDIREIRIRVDGVCSVLFLRESITLSSSVSLSEMERLIDALSDGSLYAHRESISAGYITVDGGIRVGVVGTARYESGSIAGISDIRYALIRIPGAECAFGREIYEIWTSAKRGMLIYSPPGVGKTTALRSLARDIGSGENRRRVAVIDERFEFVEDFYTDCEVDILKGYKRREGIEIATRTMSPEVLMIDEIGADDAYGIAESVRCGIPLIASVHAGSFPELMKKKSLEPLLSLDAFDIFVGISRDGDGYRLAVDNK